MLMGLNGIKFTKGFMKSYENDKIGYLLDDALPFFQKTRNW